MPSAAWSHKTDGTAERRASEAMLKKQAEGSKRITVGEDKAYDTSDHIAALRRMNVTPHVAQNDSLTKTGKRRRSAIDARTTRHIGYQISQTCRKMAECIFGWGKQHGTMRKTKHRGIAAVAADFMLNLIAYDRAHPRAHRRLRRSLPASRKTGSDRPKIQQQRTETGLAAAGFFSKLLDWFPTLLAAAGDPTIKDRLLSSTNIGGATFKVHLDGYNQLDYLTGKIKTDPRTDFAYFDDDGDLVAYRHGDWKAVFDEQKKPGGFPVWYEPLTAYRIPKVFNLRMDPYERADVVSDQYDDWRVKNAYLMGWLNFKAAAFLQTFKDGRASPSIRS